MPNQPETSDDYRDQTLADRLVTVVWRLDELRERPAFVAAVVGLAAIGVAVSLWLGRVEEAKPIEESIPHVTLVTTIPVTSEPPKLIVHVAGQVSRPGVYELSEGDRVIDAIAAAGGSLEGSGVQQLNLASLLVDGMQVWVPAEDEMPRPFVATGLTSASGPVDLNSASADRLEELPGVGPATAKSIIAYRTEHGPFAVVDDLLAVPGIGPAKLAQISEEAVVR